MRLFVNHRTEYRFTEAQRRIVQLLRVTPANFDGQNIIDWQIDVDCDARIRAGRDGYGNETAMLYIDGPVDRLTVTVSGEALTEDKAGLVAGAPEPLPAMVFLRTTPLTRASGAIGALAREASGAEKGILARAHRLNQLIFERLSFDNTRMDVERSAEDAFALGHGVCQDFAHIFVAAARAMNVPARYVSGHLYRHDGAQFQEASHAWAEAYVEDLGWIGFDAANGICPDDSYIRVAIGLDYREAAPLSGARIGGGVETLDVGVNVAQTQTALQSQS
ncbi:transglutaminase family protein [Sphingomonas sp. ID0503]|uniref:transglutaminase family protein n=1 Tax=Sphingomonas sp. ID0503 TaxID=3399691 RepID=UPI003AFA9190